MKVLTEKQPETIPFIAVDVRPIVISLEMPPQNFKIGQISLFCASKVFWFLCEYSFNLIMFNIIQCLH